MEKVDNKIPVYEFVVDFEKFPDDGLSAVSIVDSPAIIQEFQMFKENQPLKFVVQSEDEQLLVGPVLISGMKIYRVSPLKGEYYGYFSSTTIKKLVENYFKTGKVNNFTYQHQDKNINGLSIVESWFTSKTDKSKDLGFDLPEGSWMVSIKVFDSELWKKIKEDNLKGFSVEVFTDAIPIEMNETKVETDVIKLIKKLILENEIQNLNKKIADL